MEATKVGSLNGKAVYLTEDSLAIEEDHQYLREMSEEEKVKFLDQKMQVKSKEVNNG